MSDLVRPEEPEPGFRARLEAHDWSRSALGPRHSWPFQLQVVVQLILETRQPMFVAWGRSQSLVFNEAFAAILGDRSWEAMGSSLPKLWEGAWEQMGHFFQDAIAGNGALVEDQLFPTWASGYTESRYFSFSYTPIRHEGAVCGVMCMCTDTTDKVQAQELVRLERDALSHAFEHAPGFIAMTEGSSHRFTFANAAYRRLVGGRHVIGETVAEVLPEVVEQGFVALLDEVIQTGHPFTAQAMPVRLRNYAGVEETRYVDFIYAPRSGADGNIIGIFCEGHDVTDRVTSARQIGDLQAELIHASRGNAMNVMASTLAHELNQPLSAITSYASAARRLLETGVPEEAATCLQGVVESTSRAGNIIRGARALVEQRTGSSQAVSLELAIQEVVRILQGRPCQIELNLDRGSVIKGDKVQIQQVFLNLLRNACEAAGSSLAPVEVTARVVDNSVLTTVSDRGEGISGSIDSIFDAFFSSKADGMGLGLAISRTIIEAHGGRIWAENRPGGGATFYCDLPRVVEASGD